jgi:hypothetical protein
VRLRGISAHGYGGRIGVGDSCPGGGATTPRASQAGLHLADHAACTQL